MPEIPKTYEPQKYEDKIYALWEKSGFFNPDNLKLPKNAKAYSIVLPPPNITDKLHLGHSSMLAIEDLLIRFHRMKGYRALWIPGTDHAAIATQNVVEKKLLKEKNITRHDLGRDKFLKEVWKFLRVTQKTILNQTRKMGASLDWSREAFTLDDERQKAVTRMFVEMHEAGAIYRGERIVNWCPRCKSTLADDEVEYKEQKTKLYTFRYWKNFPISISTTRPETKLGDTAVAVNPKDARYKKYIGQEFEGFFCGIALKIKIISDRNVDANFGTGALGVTPAHSMIDWKMAEDNKLEKVKVIDEDGNIKKDFGEFSGKTALRTRELVVSRLKEDSLIEKEDDIENNLSVCYRCATTIEPLPSKQWFVNVNKPLKKLGNKSLKDKAIEVVKKKKIEFIPFRFTKSYLDWMNNLHDWCISRQIWFGHKIPVWYKSKDIYVGEIAPKGKGWKQDPDSLDTWFSSGMWTFSTLGWHSFAKASAGKSDRIIKTGDLARFHPMQVLETGYDILTLWVSRMILMSSFAMKEIPFEKVYLHGLVLDKFGKKMSKSKGNGIDPLDMISIYGADAVRMAILLGSTPGNDVRISEEKIESFRNYVTKIWNIYRYSAMAYADFNFIEKINKKDIKSLADRWIVSNLNNVSGEITKDLENYRFSMAGEKLQKFVWNDFADWYLEINKAEKNSKILGYVLDKILKLSHPFAPFVTEKIWQDFFQGRKILMVEKWPVADNDLLDKKAKLEFDNLKQVVTKIRNIRTSYHIDPGKTIQVFAKKIENKEILEKMARIKIEIVLKSSAKGIAIVGKNIKLTLAISDLIDVEKEKARLEKEITNFDGLITKIEALFKNSNFVKSAPKEVIVANKVKLKEYQEKLKIQRELLKNCIY
jgi:valyl-tRNA synthetase